MPFKKVDPVVRFWRFVDRRGDEECWLWQGEILKPWGHGRFSVSPNERIVAHRFAYELLVGVVPEGLVLDHLCRVPACVNPAHLEPVTNRENVIRGVGPTAVNARKTHCIRGHELTPENTWTQKSKPGRHCKLCAQIRREDLRARGLTALGKPFIVPESDHRRRPSHGRRSSDAPRWVGGAS